MSESIMNQFGVGQDEFIFRMYSIALVAITGAAIAMGDMRDGIVWIMQPGTYDEQLNNVPLEERAWSSSGKIGAMIVSQLFTISYLVPEYTSHSLPLTAFQFDGIFWFVLFGSNHQELWSSYYVDRFHHQKGHNVIPIVSAL